jgi:hypothetical protein
MRARMIRLKTVKANVVLPETMSQFSPIEYQLGGRRVLLGERDRLGGRRLLLLRERDHQKFEIALHDASGGWALVPAHCGDWRVLSEGESCAVGDPRPIVTVVRQGRRWLARRYEVHGFGTSVLVQSGIFRRRIVSTRGQLLARDLPTRFNTKMTEGEAVLVSVLVASEALMQMWLPVRVLFASAVSSW